MILYYFDTENHKCVEVLDVEEVVSSGTSFRYRKVGSKKFSYIKQSPFIKVFNS